VASAADDLVDQSNERVTTLAVRQLGETLPGLQSRQLLRSVVVRERRASFSVAPGGPARPSVRTAVGGFYLAGDWTETGLPATIEGAAQSGHRAAAAVIADTGGT
jgi:uncharacterized protein with NAD-binding domain and iron-sulfur cluster